MKSKYVLAISICLFISAILIVRSQSGVVDKEIIYLKVNHPLVSRASLAYQRAQIEVKQQLLLPTTAIFPFLDDVRIVSINDDVYVVDGAFVAQGLSGFYEQRRYIIILKYVTDEFWVLEEFYVNE